mmetsp:Transcript_5700/g.13385  ORF Transcript_5700/g.13385 Transcript_5700/m.13385 type:complete len:105 (-) Transcript_5700:103-417(-)
MQRCLGGKEMGGRVKATDFTQGEKSGRETSPPQKERKLCHARTAENATTSRLAFFYIVPKNSCTTQHRMFCIFQSLGGPTSTYESTYVIPPTPGLARQARPSKD